MIHLHDLSRGPVFAQERGHDAHGAIDVPEKGLVSFTQIIQPSLPFRGLDEPVFGAAAVAGKTDHTFLAIGGQQVQFVLAELLLLGRGHHFDHGGIGDVSQEMVRGDEVIAGVHISVMFQGQGHPAGRREHAQTWRLSGPVGQGDVEHIDKCFPHIMAHPFLEDSDQKAAILPGGDREIAYDLVFHPALDDGDELDVADTQIIPQEAVDVQRVIGIGLVDGHQGVKLHPMFLQIVQALHHPIEGRLALLIPPKGIVPLTGPVDADPYQKVVFPEKSGPFVIDQGAVGLDGIQDSHTGAAIFLLVLDRASKKIQAHQHRLAALPGQGHLGKPVGLDEPADIGLLHLARHAEAAAGVELLLGKVETIAAGQVADGSRRFGQKVKGRWRGQVDRHQSETGGRRSFQGRAFSSWAAKRKSVASSPNRPANWTPMGTLALFQ